MLMSSRLSVCSALIIALAACNVWGDEPRLFTAPESTLKPWTDAVERFRGARDAAGETLIRLLDAAEEKARAAGDLEKVEAIKKERDAFEASRTLPTLVKPVAYSKSMDAAKSSLKNAAQKIKVTLVRQKFDEDAKAIDQQLADLLNGTSDTSAPNATLSRDRNHWVEQRKDGNEWLLIKPREWVETTHDGTRMRHEWKEVARTSEYVELRDDKRNRSIRLRAGTREERTGDNLASNPIFEKEAEGDWVEPTKDVVYLSDLNELSHHVLVFNSTQGFGWGKAGRMMGKDDKWEDIYLANRPSPKGIFTHPHGKGFAMVDYDIGRFHKSVFRAQFGIADAKSGDSASPLTFVVIGDGKRLFVSKQTQKWGVASDCEVSIKGVKHLELRVECPGDPGFAYAIWAEPRLSD